MSWTDRQWDDWVRGQPGTFWGEEKRRLSRPASTPPAHRPPKNTHVERTSDQASPQRREKSIEEYLHGLILLMVGGGVGYLAYQFGAAAWLVGTAAVGVIIPVHLALESKLGQRFLRLLSLLLGLGILALVVYAIIEGVREHG